MKAQIYDLEGKKLKEIDLPKQFEEEVRPDIIKKAVLAVQSHNRQAYGAKPNAGERQSAVLSRRRRDFKTAYGHGISRVPRKTMWARGTQFGWVGAFAPGTVGGRRAHHPKVTKKWWEIINKKERRKAIRSALSAAAISALVKQRGHRFDFEHLPLIIEDKFENLKKTKEIGSVLVKLGLEKELKRISEKKIRAGRGKSRGRKYQIKKGPLIVVSKSCPLEKSAANIQGVEVCNVKNLNAELLAPGTIPGRLIIFTENAIHKLDKEKLFTQDYKEVIEK